MKLSKIITMIFVVLSLNISGLYAYNFEPGAMFLKPMIGSNVNVARFDALGKETPAAGLMLGAQGDYLVDIDWGVSADLRIVLSPNFVNLDFAGGVKYRFLEAKPPFIPYAGVYLNTKFLFPTNDSSFHFNFGLRPTAGVNYFISRNLALGVEVFTEPSIMFMMGEIKFEFSAGAMFTLTLRV